MKQEYVFKLSDDEKEVLYKELNKIQYDPTGSTRYITEVRMPHFGPCLAVSLNVSMSKKLH